MHAIWTFRVHKNAIRTKKCWPDIPEDDGQRFRRPGLLLYLHGRPAHRQQGRGLARGTSPDSFSAAAGGGPSAQHREVPVWCAVSGVPGTPRGCYRCVTAPKQRGSSQELSPASQHQAADVFPWHAKFLPTFYTGSCQDVEATDGCLKGQAPEAAHVDGGDEVGLLQ